MNNSRFDPLTIILAALLGAAVGVGVDHYLDDASPTGPTATGEPVTLCWQSNAGPVAFTDQDGDGWLSADELDSPFFSGGGVCR